MKLLSMLIIVAVVIVYISFNTNGNNKSSNAETFVNQNKVAKVTFIELGSVNCIPCKQMQPVMKAIEKKYGDQIKVIFYDVWTNEQKPYAEKYGIKLIPTQVFLDENEKEFHRHEGFYPEAEIDKILQSRGLQPKKG